MPITTTFNLGDRDIAEDADIARSKIAQRVLAVASVPIQEWRVWDALGTNIATPASDDLGITTGTFGTHAPYISTGDLKAAGSTTRRARTLMKLPPDYQDGQTVTVRLYCSAVTTVADASMTVDVEAWRLDKDGTLGAADICATAAQSINNLTVAAYNFTITPTTLVAGDQIDVRLSVLVNDAATVTAVIGAVWQTELLADLR